ncbi:GAF domain-containing protein [Zhongshania marina]|uniref:Diguanylate cyclase n=1 Tax=Zhongshania marina TaxID=2304603 RepID=A0ABX9W824_9GAMM|nr:diguanylate cyclase [Zhongshania marina]
MEIPRTPDNESKRLASLQSLNILDTPFEERFDRITRFASELFDVPIALVSLIDQDRQWFKSAQGLDVRETSRAISFCGHTILSRNIMSTADASVDERFFDNPLVLGEPYIRFYAGCPLLAEDGNALGTLCLIDRRPRILSQDDLDVFRDLALIIEREIIRPELDILDEVTSISTRNSFSVLAEKGLDLCARRNISASLVFIELDDAIGNKNQTESAERNKMLVRFSECLNTHLEQSALVARVGENQFSALLVDASAAEAELAMMKFKTKVEELNRNENWLSPLSLSHGIAEFNSGKHSTVEKLLTDADLIMYDNKKQKRYAAMKSECV